MDAAEAGLADNIEYRFNSSKTESGSGKVMVIYQHELPIILAALRSAPDATKVPDASLLKRATAIVMHGRTTTYPSISSAEQVRNVMAEMVVALSKGGR